VLCCNNLLVSQLFKFQLHGVSQNSTAWRGWFFSFFSSLSYALCAVYAIWPLQFSIKFMILLYSCLLCVKVFYFWVWVFSMVWKKHVWMSAVELRAWYGLTYNYRSCAFVYLTMTFSWTIAGTHMCTSPGPLQYSVRASEMASIVAKEFETERPQCIQESTTLKTGLNRRRKGFMWNSMQLHHHAAISQEFWRLIVFIFFILAHNHG